jgi:hypothetical protein
VIFKRFRRAFCLSLDASDDLREKKSFSASSIPRKKALLSESAEAISEDKNCDARAVHGRAQITASAAAAHQEARVWLVTLFLDFVHQFAQARFLVGRLVLVDKAYLHALVQNRNRRLEGARRAALVLRLKDAADGFFDARLVGAVGNVGFLARADTLFDRLVPLHLLGYSLWVLMYSNKYISFFAVRAKKIK